MGGSVERQRAPEALCANARSPARRFAALSSWPVWDSQIDFFGPQAPCPVLRGS